MSIRILEGYTQNESGGKGIGEGKRTDPRSVVSARDDIYSGDLVSKEFCRDGM
jgi:hypothetical protein